MQSRHKRKYALEMQLKTGSLHATLLSACRNGNSLIPQLRSGTTAHLILALGIHRKRRMETSTGADLIELECRKRVFWSAYGLDSYLSSSLGRPRTFHDDDIDQVYWPNTICSTKYSANRETGTPKLCERLRPYLPPYYT